MISDYHDTLGGLDKDFESTEIEDEYNLRNGLSFLNEDTAVQFIEKWAEKNFCPLRTILFCVVLCINYT